jgi:hypothetical protein
MVLCDAAISLTQEEFGSIDTLFVEGVIWMNKSILC